MSPLAIFGGGTMGSGIAALAIGHGVSVVLIDVDEAIVRDAVGRVHDQVRHGTLIGAFPEDVAQGVLTTGTDPAAAAGADLVIEAITEDVTLKAKLLAEVAEVTGPRTPLVSNTSGIPIDELADAQLDPARLAGAHFMNPTYLINTTELIRGPRTGDAAMAAVSGLLERLGRKTVVVRDAPGFVTSR